MIDYNSGNLRLHYKCTCKHTRFVDIDIESVEVNAALVAALYQKWKESDGNQISIPQEASRYLHLLFSWKSDHANIMKQNKTKNYKILPHLIC